MERTALVTGASSGIGFETALRLRNLGFVVYAGARRAERLAPLEKDGIQTVVLDVTDERSMVSCVEKILENQGRIDLLVNNAGYGSFGAVEDVSREEARRQVEVNLFGLARMIQLVLPAMRSQGGGRIVNISSMGGKVHTPFGAWYHATKFAVEGFSDCLRMETAPFGIDVVIVEPGGIKTDWGFIAARHLRESSAGGAYEKEAGKYADSLERMFSTGKGTSSPSLIADVIAKAATARKPKTRYLVGANAKPAVLMRRLLSDRAYDRLMRRVMGLARDH
jgi:NAD(P)-dependent dehydrogenase (short-subunit alcohol dehydrogenase family)